MSSSFPRNMTRHRACAFREEIMGDKVRHVGLTAAALCAVAGLTATPAAPSRISWSARVDMKRHASARASEAKNMRRSTLRQGEL